VKEQHEASVMETKALKKRLVELRNDIDLLKTTTTKMSFACDGLVRNTEDWVQHNQLEAEAWSQITHTIERITEEEETIREQAREHLKSRMTAVEIMESNVKENVELYAKVKKLLIVRRASRPVSSVL
jgi:hypothetical protein